MQIPIKVAQFSKPINTNVTRRMPGGPAGELLALEQNDALAEMCKVIGNAASDDAAPDHHDICRRRKLAHDVVSS